MATPRHHLVTSRQRRQAKPAAKSIDELSPRRLPVDNVVGLCHRLRLVRRSHDRFGEAIDVRVREGRRAITTHDELAPRDPLRK